MSIVHGIHVTHRPFRSVARHICAYAQAKNRMTLDTLAIVLAPNLLRPKDERDVQKMARDNPLLVAVVAELARTLKQIFFAAAAAGGSGCPRED